MSFEVHCNFCNGNFIFEQEPVDFVCICRNKPKLFSKLLHCSNGHTSWINSMNGECDECQKQKTIKTAKKLLAIQSDPKRMEIEQSIVKTDQIIRQKKEDFFKRKMLIDDSIIEIPNLLKELIKTVDSIKKEDENNKKLDDLSFKLKDMETKFVQ